MILEKLNTQGADPVAMAKEHGYEFDEEYIEAGQAHMDSLTNEMSEDELDGVAGGGMIRIIGKDSYKRREFLI